MSHKGSVSKGFKKSLVIGGCLLINTALAGGPEPTPLEAFPLLPGVSLYGFGGNGWTAIGDAMAPVLGQPTSFTYIDPQIYYHSDDSEYTASVGAGQRWLTESAGIIGAYVFGDYNHSDNGNGFWFVSPGVERLGSVLDFSANLYIPVSTQRINTGLEFADDVGDFSQVTFAGHNQYDMLVNTFDATGWGGDAQIGVRLPFRNSEVYLGGYYFSPKDSDTIGGGSVRLQVPINNYFSALFSEAYDSGYHNTVKAGLTVWFGGRHTGYSFTGDLRERLVDPIQRNLIAVAGGSHTGQPIVQDVENTGQKALEVSNISFFVPGAAPDASAGLPPSQGTGTYENPYVGMTQDNVDNANAQNNRNFYINSGTYNAVYGMTDPDYIVLNNDQLYGRENGFKQAATGNARALINFANGGFEIPDGDVNDSINGLRLTGNQVAGNAGIWIDHDSSSRNLSVTVNNTDVQNFGDGIDAVNNASSALWVNITHSLISNNSGGGELAGLSLGGVNAEGGVAAINNGTGSLNLTVIGSTISNNNNTLDNFFNAVGGLAAVNAGDGSMTINVVGSNLSGNAVDATNESVDAVGGLAAENGNPEEIASNGVIDINVTHSTLSGNSFTANETDSSFNFTDAAGGLAAVNNGASMDIDVNRSNLSGNSVSASVDAESFANYSIGAAGGLAASNKINDMTVDVDFSKLSGNSVIADNADIGAAGGLAVDQSQSDEPDELLVADTMMTIDVSHSSLTGNSVNLTNSGAGAAGGLAANNASRNADMIIDVDSSHVSGNSVVFDETAGFRGVVDSAGGLAAFNSGTMTIDVDHSSISGNSVTANASDFSSTFIDAAGGLAADNFGTEMTIDVDHSSISSNSVSVNASDFSGVNVFAAGGLAVNQASQGSTLTVDVDRSQLVGNIISADLTDSSFGFIGAAGGLAVNQVGFVMDDSSSADTGDITIDVDRSSISKNSVSVNATDSEGDIDAAGGLAISQDADVQSPLTVDVKHSSLSGNVISTDLDDSSSTISAAGGLAINQSNGFNGIQGTLVVDVDHSSLSGNVISADLNNFSSSIIGAAGGLAISRQASPFLDTNDSASVDTGYATIDVDHSNISGNSVSVDVTDFSQSQIDAAGGLAVDDLEEQQIIPTEGTELDINVDHSSLSGNSVSANVSSESSSLIGTAGGLAVAASQTGIENGADVDSASDSVPNVSITVSHSNLAKNSVLSDATTDSDSFIGAAGGLAVGNATPEMDVTVDHSNIFGNSVSLTNTNVDSAGGIAAVNFRNGNLVIDVDYSHIFNNSVSAATTDATDGSNTLSTLGGNVSVAGGIAADNIGSFSDMTIEVSHSSVFGNSVNLTNINADSAGGFAALNEGSDMTIDVNDSNIVKNSVNSTNSSFGAAGGLAVVNNKGNDITIDVNDSNIVKNSVNSTNSSFDAAGGLALVNLGNQMTVDVSHSKFLWNSVSVAGMSLAVSPTGGIALNNDLGNSMDVTISNSIIAHNSPSGLDVTGGANVTLDQSIVAWNQNTALIANDGAIIDVTSPVFFKGVVAFDTSSGSSITFQGLTPQPVSGDEVFCLFGTCQIVQ